MTELIGALAALLERVRLELEVSGDGGVLVWEKRRTPVAELCLDDIDEDAMDGELMAIAAAFEAAVKYPGRLVPGEGLREGAAALLPKLERARFARAYDAVVRGRGEDPAILGLYARDIGGGLITTYVQDEGWRFNHIPRGRIESWGASADTVHSVGRSNLYHRAALDHRASRVELGDGYDAARVLLVGDVFYDRLGAGGVEVAVPCRDQLMLGPGLSAAAVREAYANARYPISPLVFQSNGERLTVEDRSGSR